MPRPESVRLSAQRVCSLPSCRIASSVFQMDVQCLVRGVMAQKTGSLLDCKISLLQPVGRVYSALFRVCPRRSVKSSRP